MSAAIPPFPQIKKGVAESEKRILLLESDLLDLIARLNGVCGTWRLV